MFLGAFLALPSPCCIFFDFLSLLHSTASVLCISSGILLGLEREERSVYIQQLGITARKHHIIPGVVKRACEGRCKYWRGWS